MAKTRVIVMDPKYAAVKGSRGPEIRCCAYTSGPIKTAHDAKNSIEPMDHLDLPKRISIFRFNIRSPEAKSATISRQSTLAVPSAAVSRGLSSIGSSRLLRVGGGPRGVRGADHVGLRQEHTDRQHSELQEIDIRTILRTCAASETRPETGRNR